MTVSKSGPLRWWWSLKCETCSNEMPLLAVSSCTWSSDCWSNALWSAVSAPRGCSTDVGQIIEHTLNVCNVTNGSKSTCLLWVILVQNLLMLVLKCITKNVCQTLVNQIYCCFLLTCIFPPKWCHILERAEVLSQSFCCYI